MDDTKKGKDSRWDQIEPVILDKIKEKFSDSKELVDNVNSIAQLIKGTGLTTDSDARKLAIDFLPEAERDIQSCKVLYSKRIYPHAVYHLQQAVEKAAKGYMLGFGFLNKAEIKTHDTPELFLKAVFEKTGIKAWAERLDDKDLKTLIDNAEQAIHDDDKRQEIALISPEAVCISLSKIDSYQNIGKQICQDLSEEVSSILGKNLPPSPLLQSISAMATLFILATISFPHEAYTRYPDRSVTPSDYVPSLGIVHEIPRMTKYLTKGVQDLKAVLS